MNICHQDRDDLNFPPHHHDPLGVDGAAPGLLAAELRHLALVPHLGSGWLLYVIVPINFTKQPPHPDKFEKCASGTVFSICQSQPK